MTENTPETAWPRISVITPSLNQGAYLEQSLRSVLGQGYPNLEYIVMDGGSTDESLDIIRRYAPRLHHWSSGPDGGQTDAINRGMHIASGEIVTWLNSDDCHAAGTLIAVAEAFRRQQADVVYGDYRLITEAGVPFLTRREIPFDYATLLYGVNFIGQPASFFRRDLLEKHGYLDERLTYVMDWEFWLRVAGHGARFVHIRRILADYRYHAHSKTVGQEAAFRAEIGAMRARYRPPQASLASFRSFAARVRRQWVKLRYQHTIDIIGGPLPRLAYVMARRRAPRPTPQRPPQPQR